MVLVCTGSTEVVGWTDFLRTGNNNDIWLLVARYCGVFSNMANEMPQSYINCFVASPYAVHSQPMSIMQQGPSMLVEHIAPLLASQRMKTFSMEVPGQQLSLARTLFLIELCHAWLLWLVSFYPFVANSTNLLHLKIVLLAATFWSDTSI